MPKNGKKWQKMQISGLQGWSATKKLPFTLLKNPKIRALSPKIQLLGQNRQLKVNEDMSLIYIALFKVENRATGLFRKDTRHGRFEVQNVHKIATFSL